MNSAVDNWDDLRVFLATTRAGTLARAGEALGVNQSTVFRRIGALEDRLGSRLFEKRGRGYVLTATGERLAALVARMEDDVHTIERELVGSDQELRGDVRVTTADTIAMRLIGPYLAEFASECPGVRVSVNVDNRLYVLGRGEADVALRPGARPVEQDVVPRRIGAISGALYASADYVARYGRPRRRADLAHHRIIGVDESLAHVRYARHIDNLVGDAAVVMRCSSLLTQCMAVEQGLGIAALPCFMLDRQPHAVRLFACEPELDNELWLVVHRDLRRAARIRAFVDSMSRQLEADRALLEGKAR